MDQRNNLGQAQTQTHAVILYYKQSTYAHLLTSGKSEIKTLSEIATGIQYSSKRLHNQ